MIRPIPFNRKNNNLMPANFEEFSDMLRNFFSNGWFQNSRGSMKDTFKLDLKESNGEYLVEAEMPGVKKEEIDLSIENQVLSIFINREEDELRNKDYIYKERQLSFMSRSIHLEGARMDKIKARLDNGVLTITVPIDWNTKFFRKITVE